MTWADVFLTSAPQDPELWLNPGDWEDLGRPGRVQLTALPELGEGWRDMPVRTSLGVPAGSARFFDRESLRYLPVARPA